MGLWLTTIWPGQSAPEGVAKGIVDNFVELEGEQKVRSGLAAHMGQTHATVVRTCAEYKEKIGVMRCDPKHFSHTCSVHEFV